MAEAALKQSAEAATDPLLAALIAKLPQTGAHWPAEKRAAWLELAWKSFDLVYEGGDATELPAFLRITAGPVGGSMAAAAAAPRFPPPGTALGPVEYIIDINGFLKRLPDGARITFNDIPRGEVLWDERPEGSRHDDIKAADGEWPFALLPQLSIANR